MNILARGGLAAALVAAALSASAHEFTLGELTLDHPWIAEPPPGGPVAAGYLTITNDGEHADRLVSIHAEFAEKSEVHEMVMDDAGVMQMRPLESGLEIPMGDAVVLEPGGFHLMFMHVAERPVEGDMVPVTLVFEHAGEIVVEFEVHKGDDMGHDDGHDDMDMEGEESQ